PLVRRAFSLKQYTLRAVSKELLSREKLDVPPLEMEEYWLDTGEKFKKFIDYSRRDAELALELILNLKLLDKYVALAQVSGSLLQEVVDGGQTSMVETLLLKEFGLRDRVLLPKPDDGVSAERYEMSSDLKGGEVLEPKKGLLENVLILDYKSLYPTIMMAHNLCYTTVVTGDRSDGVTIRPPSGGEFVPSEVYKGIVPSILEDLLNKRTQTKKRMRGASNENEYRVLDATQLALKILLNSFYGYSGYARARLYSLTLANAVTSFGRNNILNTREIINSTIGKIILRNKTALLLDEAGELSPQDRVVELSVAYGDTDSVFVHCKSRGDLSLEEVSLIGNRLANIVSASLPDPMELEFESIAKR
ncbi:MAG TPA: DNA-directed DNA polymerase, partial [Methanosarcina vacuolata]|nr:DNA-directed DNA polymerase [Methanosarcina vacuolata]